MELGKKLVNQLGLDDSVNTLARWMAHDLAENLNQLENAANSERAKQSKECRELILSIWSHVFSLPDGKRPFETFEPIFRALESLDPENDMNRYFRPSRKVIQESETNGELKAWLECVDGLDYTARLLISYTLSCASESVDREAEAWGELAQAAGIENAPRVVIKFISSQSDLMRKDDLDEREREIIEERIARLESFTLAAEQLSNALRSRLEEIPIQDKE